MNTLSRSQGWMLHGGLLAIAVAFPFVFSSSFAVNFGVLALFYAFIGQSWNIAGGFAWEKVQDGSTDTWDRMYQMNVRTAVAASQAALAHLPDGGRIVNIGANGAVKAGAGMGAYAASKAGVMRFTEALAEELKGRGITVNALLPSIIDTPANRADMPDADFSAWVQPAQLADAIVFLLSDKASAITGALVPVVGRV